MPKSIASLILILLSLTGFLQLHGQEQKKPYNVLFISIDDLNNWASPFGGNPQVKTLHLERFSQESIVMNMAFSPASVCGPSRSSILTGKLPSNTGLYGNGNNIRLAPKAKKLETLPQYFGNRGYHTLSIGKIFHKHKKDQGQWAFLEWSPDNREGKKGGMEWEKEATHPDHQYGGSPLK